MDQEIDVMQLIDTLESGGAERVAVNLANLLPRDRYRLHLCTTRCDGPLEREVANDVQRLRLARKRRFDIGALWRLLKYIRRNQIKILHAHGTSVFLAVLASLFPPYPVVIWHEHYGRNAAEDRRAFLFRLVARRVRAAICVNRLLAEWSARRLRIPLEHVWYVPNFVCEAPRPDVIPDLPGVPGARIVNVANYRTEKDQLTLLRALALVVHRFPQAHLLLVGAVNDPAYAERIKEMIVFLSLQERVSMMGPRNDVGRILQVCDVGVLSSATEGLPMALLEYGAAGLPSVATNVGQCGEVLDHGRVGALVSPAAPGDLAFALETLLSNPAESARLGMQFKKRIQQTYSPARVLEQVDAVYKLALNGRRRRESLMDAGRGVIVTASDKPFA